MATGRSRDEPADKHEWRSWEDYRALYEGCLTHPVVQSHDLRLYTYRQVKGQTVLVAEGTIICRNGVRLEIANYADCQRRGKRSSRLWVRTFSFRYNAYIPGRCTVLRYDNGHGEDEYHAHPYDAATGEAVQQGRRISREEMPHLSEVLDQIGALPL